MSAVEPQTATQHRRLDRVGYDKRLMLFSGRANPELAAKIADKLGVDLGGVTLKTFSNGEVYCRYEESIRGADVFIVQPTCGNPVTGITANDALMELLVMVDAAVGASAHRVIAVTPWYGYWRQDKKSTPREPITARLVARMLEAAGRRPRPHDGPALRPDPGLLPEAGRPHDRAVHAHPVLPRPGPRGPRRRLAGCGPREAEQEVRRRRSAPSWRSSTRSARPSRWRRSATSSATSSGKTAVIVDDMIDTAGTLKAAAQTVLDEGARARVRRRHARGVLRRRVREPRLARASRRSSSPTRSRCAPARPTTSACSPARSC